MRGCLPSSSKQKKATFLTVSLELYVALRSDWCLALAALFASQDGVPVPKKAFDENEACGRRMPIPAQAGMLGSM